MPDSGVTTRHHTERDRLRAAIVEDLTLRHFPVDGYRKERYLRQALREGYDVDDLARAHEVTPKTIYNALDRAGIDRSPTPTRGLARQLHDLDPDALGTDHA